MIQECSEKKGQDNKSFIILFIILNSIELDSVILFANLVLFLNTMIIVELIRYSAILIFIFHSPFSSQNLVDQFEFGYLATVSSGGAKNSPTYSSPL